MLFQRTASHECPGGFVSVRISWLLTATLIFAIEAGVMGFVAAQAIPDTVEWMCAAAHDRESCVTSLAAHPDAAASGPRGLATIGITNSLEGVGSFYTFTTGLWTNSNGPGEKSALSTCRSVLQGSQDHLQLSFSNMATLNPLQFKEQMGDIWTWLSTALTYHTTCLDGMNDGMVGDAMRDAVMARGVSFTSLLSTAVSLVASLSRIGLNPGHNRRLLRAEEGPIHELKNCDDFPEWIRLKDRKLLQASNTNDLTIVNAIVAKDGSGEYNIIQEAIDAAPKDNAKQWVIRIKAGVYNEYVEVPKSAKNVVILGDGVDQTIIRGSKSVVGSNVTTFATATMGEHFIGRDFTVRNTAGAINHQAVALKVQSDKSAFWRCSFEGYQDTLYTHSNRQFYKDCTIFGTVDFIFGNAAAVFQSCTLLARTPLPGQQNTFTAQGRTTSSQNTGFSFQNCVVDAAPELKNFQNQAVNSYLGRPWKEFSRTVFLMSTLTNVINPEGWLPWNGALFLNTLFYGEYKNTGSGSGTDCRVPWSTQIHDPSVANQFTVNSLISGAYWLPQTTIVYNPEI